MTKLTKLLASIAVLYILGFFLWAPIQLFGISAHWFWLANLTSKINAAIYTPLAKWSGEDGVLTKIRYQNTVFWCNKFEHCHVQ